MRAAPLIFLYLDISLPSLVTFFLTPSFFDAIILYHYGKTQSSLI